MENVHAKSPDFYKKAEYKDEDKIIKRLSQITQMPEHMVRAIYTYVEVETFIKRKEITPKKLFNLEKMIGVAQLIMKDKGQLPH